MAHSTMPSTNELNSPPMYDIVSNVMIGKFKKQGAKIAP